MKKKEDKVAFETLRSMIRLLEEAIKDAAEIADQRELQESERLAVHLAAHMVEAAIDALVGGLPIDGAYSK